jgi:hypothetical protein
MISLANFRVCTFAESAKISLSGLSINFEMLPIKINGMEKNVKKLLSSVKSAKKITAKIN